MPKVKKIRAARPAAAKRAPRSRRWRWIAVGSVVFLFALAAWLILPFWRLAGQFGREPLIQPSRLYARSTVLRVGDFWTVKRLVKELDKIHYERRDPGASLMPGSFNAADSGRVEIYRRRFPTPSGQAGGDRLVVQVRGTAIKSLAIAGAAVDQALLEPPLITSFYDDDLRERRPVGLDEVPEDLAYAVLAAEDAYFLEHSGVSFKGILRAAWVNLRAKEVRQGGSTLTQQLVKNIYLTHERTVVRKVQEAILAVLLELRFDKRDIFQAYLNEIYLGRSGNVHLMGIGAAAWAYFGKSPAQLDLAEAALLAGMIQSPAYTSPIHHPERARQRRDAVLARLGQLGWVEEARLKEAAESEIVVAQGPLMVRRAPYFTDFVEHEARRRFAVEELRDAGYTLLTTLDLDDQGKAEEAVDWGVTALEDGWEKGRKVKTPLQAALVSIDPKSGEILAYVGGRDYGQSQFDRLSQARRQAGSAFKPIVYAAAFAQGIAHPATLIEDAPFTVRLAGQTWSPQNSNGAYHGWVSARRALEDSLNVPTARLAQKVGLGGLVELAHRMGIASDLDPYPALALGAMEVTPLELATVYSTLAAGGERPPIHGLAAVLDRQGQPLAGKPLPARERVLSREVSFLITRLLQGVLDRGTGRKARTVHGIDDPLAGKTGTTNSRRDSWFAGYSPDRTTLVWVGYDDNASTRLSGSRAALPVWSRFVFRVRPYGGYADFTAPEEVVSAWIDPLTGGLATDRCPRVTEEVFLRGFTPTGLCPDHDGWRARPLEQPDGVGDEDEVDHPFKRWLKMLKQRRERDAHDAI